MAFALGGSAAVWAQTNADPREAAHTNDTPPTSAAPIPAQPPDGADAEIIPTGADEAAKAAAVNQAALDRLEKTLAVSKDKADALRQQVTDMNGDAAKQNAALIAADQRVKLAEIEVDSLQQRLNDLGNAEKQVQSRLDGADASVSNMLAALERISLNPPPALIVDPADAVGSARSAMLISAILPQLRDKASQVVADLKHLQQIRADAEQQQIQLKANFAVLQEEQLRIATLLAARKQSLASASAELGTADQNATATAAKVDALKQLIATLSAKADAVSQSATAPGTSNGAPPTTPEEIRVALANTARTAPALPFADVKGYLTLPVVGEDVQNFGDGDGLGGIADGNSYLTAPGAKVVAPADGWVVYKGPYLNYGQIVILNPGDGYTIVLAGLEAVTADLGQFVREGEPLGTMGSRTIGRTVATSAGVSQPTLYIELRKNDQPMDPTGWWASPSNPTQSG